MLHFNVAAEPCTVDCRADIALHALWRGVTDARHLRINFRRNANTPTIIFNAVLDCCLQKSIAAYMRRDANDVQIVRDGPLPIKIAALLWLFLLTVCRILLQYTEQPHDRSAYLFGRVGIAIKYAMPSDCVNLTTSSLVSEESAINFVFSPSFCSRHCIMNSAPSIPGISISTSATSASFFFKKSKASVPLLQISTENLPSCKKRSAIALHSLRLSSTISRLYSPMDLQFPSRKAISESRLTGSSEIILLHKSNFWQVLHIVYRHNMHIYDRNPLPSQHRCTRLHISHYSSLSRHLS